MEPGLFLTVGSPPASRRHLTAAAQRVVYVSCDPATLARDLARLLSAPAVLPSYRLSALRCFDLFPQTAHVETVAVLDRV